MISESSLLLLCFQSLSWTLGPNFLIYQFMIERCKNMQMFSHAETFFQLQAPVQAKDFRGSITELYSPPWLSLKPKSRCRRWPPIPGQRATVPSEPRWYSWTAISSPGRISEGEIMQLMSLLVYRRTIITLSPRITEFRFKRDPQTTSSVITCSKEVSAPTDRSPPVPCARMLPFPNYSPGSPSWRVIKISDAAEGSLTPALCAPASSSRSLRK